MTNEHLDAVLATCPVGLLAVARGGEIRRANEPAAALFGFASGELDGVAVAALLPGLAGRFDGAAFEARGEPGLRRDGAVLAVDVAAAGPDAGAGVALVSVHDATARATAEASRARLEGDLADLARAVSHDVRAPLRHIQGFAAAIEEDCAGRMPDETKRYLERIRSASAQMDMLVQGLLRVARSERDRTMTVDMDLGRLADDARAQHAGALTASGGEIAIAPLPTASVDVGQLRRVFAELFDNAIKFRGEAPLRVDVAGGADGPWVTVSVSDNGVGFGPRDFERIFAIFGRLHAPGRYPGVGVGLSWVKRVIERHGGTITASGEAGRGARFTIRLPRVSPLTS